MQNPLVQRWLSVFLIRLPTLNVFMGMNNSTTSMKAQSRLPVAERTLGYLGLFPFVYVTLGLNLDLPLPYGLEPLQVFVSYSAIILAFMAGCLWRHSVATSLFSNVLAIAAFAILLLPMNPELTLLSLAVLYLVLLGWEGFYCRPHYPQGYWPLRCQLTAVVVVCHVILYARVFL